MDFFDILANRGWGRYAHNPPEKFMTPASLRDVDTQRYLIVDAENDISDGNLGLALTPGAAVIPNREDQTTEDKESAYDSSISEPSITRDRYPSDSKPEETKERDMSLFNPFGGDAGDTIDEAAAKAEAERVAAAVAEQFGRTAADEVSNQYEEPPLVGLQDDDSGRTYQAEPPVDARPAGNPLANIWFLGAVGLGLWFVLGGKK